MKMVSQLRKKLRGNEAFTLIELMIVVAIIGILAAIAIPNFVRFQLRTKAGEGKLNLTGIRTAEGGYFGEFGTYIRVPKVPNAVAGAGKNPWDPCPAAITMAIPEAWCIMGFTPEGPTYYTYQINTVNANPAAKGDPRNVDYFADAQSDLDGDTTTNNWGLETPAPNATKAAVGGGQGKCGAQGVRDELGVTGLTNQVGPCGIGFGSAIF